MLPRQIRPHVQLALLDITKDLVIQLVYPVNMVYTLMRDGANAF